ncbi:MAG TPA: helix-turn-helix domain-containing protein [Candidatus Paceibacterota bacterium]
MIEELLNQLGLSQNEVAVYLSVVKKGKTLPTFVSKETGIKRTTVYGVINTLIAKGLLIENPSKNGKYIQVLSPNNISKLIQKEEHDLSVKRKVVQEATKILEEIYSTKTFAPPKIRFVEEKNLEQFFRDRTPTWHASVLKKGGKWWGFQDKRALEQYEEITDWAWKVAPEGVELRMISNESPAEKKLQQSTDKRQIKYWDKQTDFTASTWVGGDYVIFVVVNEKPHYVIELFDALIAHNLREYFKNTWDLI